MILDGKLVGPNVVMFDLKKIRRNLKIRTF